MNLKKIIGAILAVILGGTAFGGVYSNVIKDFSEGISVDGTTVIDGSGNVDAPVTSTTGTFSSTLGVTGLVTASAGVVGPKVVTAITATTTVTAAQSGTVFSISGDTADITLPAVTTAGLTYTFVIGGAIDGNNTVTSAAGDDIEGSIIVAGAVVDCNAADVLTFVADGENIGDFVTLVSNGTNWIPLQSGALTAAKLTCSG